MEQPGVAGLVGGAGAVVVGGRRVAQVQPHSVEANGTWATTPAAASAPGSTVASACAWRRSVSKAAASSRSSAANPAAVASGFRQGARLVDGAQRGDHAHHVGPPAVGRDVEASADDLAQRREVGGDAVELLRPASHPEAGDHLVEDQQRRPALALGPQAAEEALGGGTRPMLAAIGSTMTQAVRSSSVGTRL